MLQQEHIIITVTDDRKVLGVEPLTLYEMDQVILAVHPSIDHREAVRWHYLLALALRQPETVIIISDKARLGIIRAGEDWEEEQEEEEELNWQI